MTFHCTGPEHTSGGFGHPTVSKLGEVALRLLEADVTPVLVIPIGEVSAALPL